MKSLQQITTKPRVKIKVDKPNTDKGQVVYLYHSILLFYSK